MSSTAVHHHVHGMVLFDQQRDGVGQLDLATGTAGNAAQRVEDRAVQHVTAGAAKCDGASSGLGFSTMPLTRSTFGLAASGTVSTSKTP